MAMTVLVVDDSVTMVLSLKTTLAMSGFEVETAANGQEALKKLQSGVKPNLINSSRTLLACRGPSSRSYSVKAFS